MDGDLAIDCFAWVVHSSDAKISIVSLLNYLLTSVTLMFNSSKTNSGKTHTMTGSRQTNQEGIIRLAVEDIFRLIQTQNNTGGSSNNQCSSSREYLLRVSYLEIYNEQIYDLLAPQSSMNTNQRFGVSSNLQHPIHFLQPPTA